MSYRSFRNMSFLTLLRPCWCYHQQVVTKKQALNQITYLLVAGDNTQQRQELSFFEKKQNLNKLTL
ncbi:MAG: hypothetical protein ACPG5B_06365 [Chitinophagales bacterium]